MSFRRLSTVAERLAARNASLPADAQEEIRPNADAVIYRYTDSKGRASARGYAGTAAQPAFAHWFGNEQEREEFVCAWRCKCAQRLQRTQTAREERKALRHDLKAGTILYAASGYDQTNIDFYEVVMVISPKTVEVREIEQDSQESAPGSMVGSCTPKPGAFKPTAKLLRRRITRFGIRIDAYRMAQAWDGAPKHWTAYA